MEYNKVKAERRKVKGFLSPFRGLGLLLLLLTASATTSNAQSFADWFEQGKTLIKNLEQQITALNACATGIRQGYSIAKNEWGSIKDWKYSEYSLHQGYYNSLSQVNPNIKNSTDITTIEAQQQSMISQFNTVNSLAGLTTAEQTYVQQVQHQIITQCSADLTSLQTVLSPSQLSMTDDERIKRIRKTAAAIQVKYVFTCSFCNQVRLLALGRAQENDQIQTERGLYGIN